MEVVTDFLFPGFRITADGNCSLEIRRQLFLGRKTMTNLDSVLKSRDITLLTEVHIVYAMVFLLVTYGCDSWTIKKAECQKLMPMNCGAGEDFWKSLGQQGAQTSQSWGRSTLKSWSVDHWLAWCWSWNSGILVIWCAQMTHWISPWCWERLMAEGEEGVREWDGWMVSPMQWTWTWANSGKWWGTGRPSVLQSMGLQSQTQQVTEQQQQRLSL